MAEETEKPKVVRRKRWTWRWLIRLGLWFLVFGVIGSVIIGTVAFIAFKQRTWVMNAVLDSFASPYSVEMGSIEFPNNGRVVISDLDVKTDSKASSKIVEIDEIDLFYDLDALRRDRKLERVIIRGPKLTLSTEDLKKLSSGDQKSSQSDTLKPLTNLIGLLAEGLQVEGGRVEMEGAENIPSLKLNWSMESGGLDFAEGDVEVTWANNEPMQIAMTDLELGDGPAASWAKSVNLRIKVRRDLKGIEVETLNIDGLDLRLSPIGLENFVSQKPEREKIVGQAEEVIEEKTGEPLDEPDFVTLKNFRLGDAQIAVAEFDGTGAGENFPVLPDVAFGLDITWNDLRWNGNGWSSADPLGLRIEKLRIDGALEQSDSPPLATVDAIELTLSPQRLITERTLDSISLEGPRIALTPESTARFDTAPTSAKSDPGKPWTIESVIARDGHLLSSLKGIDASAEFDFAMSQIAVGGEKPILSENEQIMEIRDLSVGGNLANVDVVSITVIPSQLYAEQPRIKNLRIAGPRIVVRENLPILPKGSNDEASTGTPTLPIFETLEITDGRIDIATDQFGPTLPNLAAQFSLKNEGNDFQAVIEQFRIRPRDAGPTNEISEKRGTMATNDVSFVRRIDIDFSPSRLLEEKQIDSLRVSGATMKVGENLKKLAAPAEEEKDPPPTKPASDPNQASAALFPLESDTKNPDSTPAPKAPSLQTGWTITEMVVTESNVRFESLIPEIEGLSFGIETRLTNVPLSTDGILDGAKNQKIELAGIEIKDPFDGFIPVAFLPSIFVEFTWKGLAQQRVEKIDLLNPSLYVGEGLFRWIRYQRDFRAQNEGASVEFEGAGEVAADAPSWEVQQINAHFGKIVIAPKGYPIGIVPFPFEASTNLDEGRIALKLEIPEEQYVYSFPDYKVDLFGLKGNVEFNIPIKQIDNNLTQTFEVDRAVFKKWEAENLYLTVTYDEEGVYGKFGGEAYSGYAEGQFNYYLKREDGAWDAWLAGTEMDTKPITDLIAPDSFRMAGKLNAKLVSEGVGTTFGETTGDFNTLEPGRIDITKADEFINELPEDWNLLKTSGTKVALEALKQFDYDTGGGTLYFLNRDGWLKLGLAGDAGERNINLHVHDWRKEKPRPAKPSPEAIATAMSELNTAE